jgi:hypothetical protein
MWQIVLLLTKSMQQTPAWDANSRSVGQEISRLFWNA